MGTGAGCKTEGDPSSYRALPAEPWIFFKFSCKILHSGAFLVRICAPWRLCWQGQHCYNHSWTSPNDLSQTILGIRDITLTHI